MTTTTRKRRRGFLRCAPRAALTKQASSSLRRADRYADIVAALSLLCGAPMTLLESLLQSDHCEGLLIPCKAAKLEWPTVRLILTCRSIGHTKSGPRSRSCAVGLREAVAGHRRTSSSVLAGPSGHRPGCCRPKPGLSRSFTGIKVGDFNAPIAFAAEEPAEVYAVKSRPMEYRNEIFVVISTRGDTTLHWAAATRSEDAVTAVELLLGPGWTVAPHGAAYHTRTSRRIKSSRQ